MSLQEITDVNNIALYEKRNSSTTAVSNLFIDTYLKDANEAQIKVYLYLLRNASGNAPVSVADMADLFNFTERDIIRSLEYWGKTSLLDLDYDDSHSIKGICLNSAPEKISQEKSSPLNPLKAKAFEARETVGPQIPEKAVNQPAPVLQSGGDNEQDVTRHFYTRAQIEEFRNRTDVSELTFMAERYFKRPINNSDINSLLYIYDNLHFPVTLISYLVDYCVNRGHVSIHYIEKTAIAWHEQGIRDVEAAKAYSDSSNKDYYTVLKAFGLSGRNPVKAEIDYIRRWQNEFGFDMNIIIEAVNRTMQNISRPSFKYADKILSEWKRRSVKGMPDIERLDQEHSFERGKKAGTPQPFVQQDKFHNFVERTYDYDELERKLRKN